jgi:cyanophycinase
MDSHVLQRDRVNRLLSALAKHPGCFGLGIDAQTAVEVKGRSLKVLGNSYAVIGLSASARRPVSVQVLKAGDQADLIALSRTAIARAAPPFPPEKPESPHVAKGSLIIGGGGAHGPEVWKRFIDLAGGPDALIVVVPTAQPDPLSPVAPKDKETGEMKVFKKFGAKNIKVLHTRKHSEADTAEFVAVLKEAKGVWFNGGRQWRLVDAYEGTLTEKAFHDVLRRGGVIGGSSAGASIQSEYMPRGDPLGNLNIIAEGYERGFGFLKGVAIDQHFFARKRLRDMTYLVDTYPQLLGIGIDEGTAVVVQGSILEVVGRSKVAIYDRRKPVAVGEKDYEELTVGMRYQLDTRRRIEAK